MEVDNLSKLWKLDIIQDNQRTIHTRHSLVRDAGLGNVIPKQCYLAIRFLVNRIVYCNTVLESEKIVPYSQENVKFNNGYRI